MADDLCSHGMSFAFAVFIFPFFSAFFSPVFAASAATCEKLSDISEFVGSSAESKWSLWIGHGN